MKIIICIKPFNCKLNSTSVKIVTFRTWEIDSSPLGESCNRTSNNTSPVEACLQPVLPDCVDKNFYCMPPPAVPFNGGRINVSQPVESWLTIPDTTLKYFCNHTNWAFNYRINQSAPSFYFANNINNITITCNSKGYELYKYQIIMFTWSPITVYVGNFKLIILLVKQLQLVWLLIEHFHACP